MDCLLAYYEQTFIEGKEITQILLKKMSFEFQIWTKVLWICKNIVWVTDVWIYICDRVIITYNFGLFLTQNL